MHNSRAHVEAFLEILWAEYAATGRHDLPWRQPEQGGSFDPYKILVSEFMLQQTQVSRVIPKYDAFLEQFPTVTALGAAPLADVLRAWQGLGYNRRAKYLWQAAHAIATLRAFPRTVAELTSLPGVGKNTAGAIVAYAYNEPVVFVETNIRTVYIHHFFSDHTEVDDAQLIPIIEETLDHEQPREYYWALMDYGAKLKQVVRNNAQSKHYTKQAAFTGSLRQIRGVILRELSIAERTREQLVQATQDERSDMVLEALLAEGLISKTGDTYRLG